MLTRKVICSVIWHIVSCSEAHMLITKQYSDSGTELESFEKMLKITKRSLNSEWVGIKWAFTKRKQQTKVPFCFQIGFETTVEFFVTLLELSWN